MPATLIASTKVRSNGGTTPSINTTGATLIVAQMSAYSGPGSFTDSYGNTWASTTGAALSCSSDAAHYGRLWYVLNPVGGGGHTFTISGNAPGLTVLVFGGAMFMVDQKTSAAALSPGSITPTEDGELLVCSLTTNNPSGAESINSSFTLAELLPQVYAENVGSALAYKNQTTAGAENPTWTSATGIYASFIASFKIVLPASFQYRIALEPGGHVIGTPEGVFPAMVRFTTNDDLKSVANGGKIHNTVSGKPADLAFYFDEALTTLAPFEISLWEPTTGVMFAWVGIENITNADWLYIGLKDPGRTTSLANPAGVWATGFGAVLHCSDNLATPTVVDSLGGFPGALDYGNTQDASVYTPQGRGLKFKAGGGVASMITNVTGTSPVGTPANAKPSTVEAWIYLEGGVRAYGPGVGSGGGDGYALFIQNGTDPSDGSQVMVIVGGQTFDGSNGVHNLGTGTWGHYVVETWSGGMLLWLNLATHSYDSGRNPSNPSNSAQFVGVFSGASFLRVAEIRWHTVTRSSDWLQTNHYTQNESYFWLPGDAVPIVGEAPPDLLSGLVSYWKLDEASGNALDAHGSHHLTQVGTVGTAAGKVGSARDFEESGSNYFEHADTPGLSGAGGLTIAVWIKLESNTAGTIVSKDSGTEWDYDLYYFDGDVYFYIEDGLGGNVEVSVTIGTSLGVWAFVVGRYDVVNDEISVSAMAGTPIAAPFATGIRDSTHDFHLGTDAGGGGFDGLIDEVGFWNRALTETEVGLLYNSGAGFTYPFSNVGRRFFLM